MRYIEQGHLKRLERLLEYWQTNVRTNSLTDTERLHFDIKGFRTEKTMTMKHIRNEATERLSTESK